MKQIVAITTALLISIQYAHSVESFDSLNGKQIDVQRLNEFIVKQANKSDTPAISFALISDGEVVHVFQAGVTNTQTNKAVTKDSIFEAASLSKPVFAYTVMRLAQEGVIELDRPLSEYLLFEELEETDKRYRTITARMVLSHTTGFPNWRWFDPAPAQANIERGTMYMKKTPGSFSYSGEAYHYLAKVLMKLLATDEYHLETVLLPFTDEMGAKPFFWTWDKSLDLTKVYGHKQGEVTDRDWPMSYPDDTRDKIGVAGRLHTNAKAYAAFLTGLFNDKFLTKTSLLQMLSPQSTVPYDSNDYKNNNLVAWGLGIGLGTSPYGTRLYHGGNNGGFQSGFTVFGAGKKGFVFFTNGDTGKILHNEFEKIIINGI